MRYPACTGCRGVVDRAVSELGGIDILVVNNCGSSGKFSALDFDISSDEWERRASQHPTAMFYLTAWPFLTWKPGSAIINTASINSDMPNRKSGLCNDKGTRSRILQGLAQLHGKDIVPMLSAPGPTDPHSFPQPPGGTKAPAKRTPIERPAQPAGTCFCLCHAGRPAVELRAPPP